MKRLILSVLFSFLAVSAASAQIVEKSCKAVSSDAVDCVLHMQNGTETAATPVVHKIGEGVVNAPGSELAYLVVANYDAVPIIVTARFLVSGLGLRDRMFLVPAYTRSALSLHDNVEDDAFQGLRTFSVRVFVPTAGADVSLAMRPISSPFGSAIIPPVLVW